MSAVPDVYGGLGVRNDMAWSDGALMGHALLLPNSMIERTIPCPAMYRRAASQSVNKRPLAIRIPCLKHPLRMHLLSARARQHRFPASIHRLEREPVRHVSQQRRNDESQRGIERRQVSGRKALLVELCANDTREVAEAIDAEDERALAWLRRVAA